MQFPHTFSISSYSDFLSRCGPFTYTITKSNGAAVPSFLTFDPTTLLFNVDTSVLVLTTSYTIKVVG